MNSKILKIGLLITALAVMSSFVWFFLRNDSNLQKVSLTIGGDPKNIIIESDIDGVIGAYSKNKIEFELSKNKHVVSVTSKGYAEEYFTVDTTNEKNIKISIELKKTAESREVLNSYFGENGFNNEEGCTYFAEKTWALCDIKSEEFLERNVFKKTGDKWVFVGGGTIIDLEMLDESGAPYELLNYLGYYE